jgi:acyl carrier protein
VNVRGDDVVRRVSAVVERTLRLSPDRLPLSPETPLLGAGLGVDSVGALELVVALEDEFGILIEDAELKPAAFRRVDSLIRLVERLLEAPPTDRSPA